MEDDSGHVIHLLCVQGEGAFGRVYQALRCKVGEQKESGTLVAVKEIPFDLHAEDVEDTLKEVFLSNTFHPNIIRFISSFVHPGCPRKHRSRGAPPAVSAEVSFSESPAICIVEELVDGGTVAEYLKQLCAARSATSVSPPSVEDEQIAAVVSDLLKALVYLHEECKIVHRDVKCANILLSRGDCSAKLCDFGTCGKLEAKEDVRSTVVGTPGWMAPEVVGWFSLGPVTDDDTSPDKKRQYGFQSDVWSVGVTVLEMVLVRPIQADSLFSQCVSLLSSGPCSISPQHQASPGLPPMKPKFSKVDETLFSSDVRDFVACCLRKDPNVRPTARQLLAHPLVVNNVGNAARKESIMRRMADTASAKNGKPVAAAIAAAPAAPMQPSLNEIFANYVNRTSRANARPAWKIPPQLESLSSVEDTTRFAALVHGPSSKSVFDTVIVPSIAHSEELAIKVTSIYRVLGGTAAPAQQQDPQNGPYTMAQMKCEDLTFEQHRELTDDLLRKFQAAEQAIPNFSSRFCELFSSMLLTSEDDVTTTKDFLTFFGQLQRDPLGHFYRSHRQQRTNLPAGMDDLSKRTGTAAATSVAAAAAGSSVAPPLVPPLGTARTVFRDVSDWAKVPTMPEFVSPNHCDATAHLYNKWLGDHKRGLLDA